MHPKSFFLNRFAVFLIVSATVLSASMVDAFVAPVTFNSQAVYPTNNANNLITSIQKPYNLDTVSQQRYPLGQIRINTRRDSSIRRVIY